MWSQVKCINFLDFSRHHDTVGDSPCVPCECWCVTCCCKLSNRNKIPLQIRNMPDIFQTSCVPMRCNLNIYSSHNTTRLFIAQVYFFKVPYYIVCRTSLLAVAWNEAPESIIHDLVFIARIHVHASCTTWASCPLLLLFSALQVSHIPYLITIPTFALWFWHITVMILIPPKCCLNPWHRQVE